MEPHEGEYLDVYAPLAYRIPALGSGYGTNCAAKSANAMPGRGSLIDQRRGMRVF